MNMESISLMFTQETSSAADQPRFFINTGGAQYPSLDYLPQSSAKKCKCRCCICRALD